MREQDRGAIRHVARFVEQDFIPRIEQRPERDVQCFTHADGDENFVLGIVGGAEVFVDVLAESLTEFEIAQVAGVMRHPLFQREDGAFPDMPGGVKVRLADAQTDYVLHRADDVEEITNAGARDIAHGACEPVTEQQGVGHEIARRA